MRWDGTKSMWDGTRPWWDGSSHPGPTASLGKIAAGIEERLSTIFIIIEAVGERSEYQNIFIMSCL